LYGISYREKVIRINLKFYPLLHMVALRYVCFREEPNVNAFEKKRGPKGCEGE